MKKPVKGEFFLIPYHACGDKPRYGTRVCQFHERKYLGCQLHGELMGYSYEFKLNPNDKFGTVTVTVGCDDKTPESQILEKLYQKIKPYGVAV
jgi:hypothetical protein